jgi:hypothetical protein
MGNKDYKARADAQIQHEKICREVFHETDAQLTQWGVQEHETLPKVRPLFATSVNLDIRTGEELAAIFRSETEHRAKRVDLDYWDVLWEEIFEATAETSDREKLETELIQSAAVIVSMVAASRRARGV